MVIPFGFSVGDFIAVIGLVTKICKAFDEGSDVSRAFQDAKVELKDFQDVVQQLKESLFTGTEISEQNAARVEQVLGDSKKALDGFDLFIASFKEMKSFSRRVKFALSGQKRVEDFRKRIQRYMTILGLVQQELSRQAIQDLSDQVQQRTEALSLQVQQEAVNIKLHIDASVEEPWGQNPIKFEDAIGRRYRVPLEVCQEKHRFLDFLEFAFKDRPSVLSAITERSIWLFTPSGKNTNLWYLIRGKDWARLACPGMRLGMSVLPATRRKGGFEFLCACDKSSRGRKTRYSSVDLVRFETPLPRWATYPENLQFEYIHEADDESYEAATSSAISELHDDVLPKHHSPAEVDTEALNIQSIRQMKPNLRPALRIKIKHSAFARTCEYEAPSAQRNRKKKPMRARLVKQNEPVHDSKSQAERPSTSLSTLSIPEIKHTQMNGEGGTHRGKESAYECQKCGYKCASRAQFDEHEVASISELVAVKKWVEFTTQGPDYDKRSCHLCPNQRSLGKSLDPAEIFETEFQARNMYRLRNAIELSECDLYKAFSLSAVCNACGSERDSKLAEMRRVFDQNMP